MTLHLGSCNSEFQGFDVDGSNGEPVHDHPLQDDIPNGTEGMIFAQIK
jgi:hypothetical protein